MIEEWSLEVPATRPDAIRPAAALLALLLVAACGAPAPAQRTATPAGAAAIVDPAQLYCTGTGGTIIPRTAGGRRADLCRLPDGRTVSAAAHLNAHNDL